jgi:DNA-binding winged helix-turn-helix (wHTH) protein
MQEFPPFQLDTANQCLWRHRETAPTERMLLTPKVFAILPSLVEHAGRLVTQEELLEAVWPETYIEPEILKSRIFEVRSALGDRPKTPRFMETLPRRRYRFIATVHAGSASMQAALADHGFPAWQAGGLLDEFAKYRRGEAAGVKAGVRDALGCSPHAFAEFARDYAPLFA